tara:strand:+ start:74 stop:745 length:672 start_codon:yes stop_codon:yes gene_type:complete
MIGDILGGATKFGASYIGGKKRLERRDQAQSAYDASLSNYFSQDTSNLYANMENTMEDLTVNTQAADFAAQQQQQGLSNIMGSMNQSAGGSGIAALAQSLAGQQAQSAQQASADIGRQEQGNQMLAAREAGNLQAADIRGQYASREQQAGLMSERAQIDANELASSEEQIQAAKAARAEAGGQFMGGVGSLATTAMGLPTEQLGKLGNLGIGLAGAGNKLGLR